MLNVVTSTVVVYTQKLGVPIGLETRPALLSTHKRKLPPIDSRVHIIFLIHE